MKLMITGKSIAKGALVVMAATLFSRLSGFIREMEIAGQFGSTGSTDAYLVAFAVPSGIGMAVAAAISAGFIPVLNGYLVSNDRNNAIKVANTLLNTIFTILLIFVALAMFFAPSLVKVLAPGFRGESVNLTVGLIRIMFPALIFTGLMGLASGFLNSHRHFLFPALGPMITNLVIIAFIIILGPSMEIKGLAAGAMAGLTCQFLFQLPVMYKKGFRYRLAFNISHPGVVKVFKLMVPVLIASLVPPLMVLVERGLASKLTTGSISALNYAFRLMQLPLGLFVTAVAVPLFPALSSFAAQKDFGRLKEIMIKGISILTLIMIPASAGLLALDEPVVRLLFQRGAFQAKDTVPTAYALAFYALALPPLAVRDIFRRGFYALQDTLTPVVITVAGLVLNIVLDLFLVKLMGIGGLALGAALSVLVEAVALYFMLDGKLAGLPGKSLLKLFLKLIAAAVIMGITAGFCSNIIGGITDIGAMQGRILQVGLSIALGLLIYFAAAFILKVEEIWEALTLVKGLYRKIIPGIRN